MNKNSDDTPVTHELHVVVKADGSDSAAAISQALERLSTRSARVVVVHSGVGPITEGDIRAAIASNAMVVGFNSQADDRTLAMAAHETIDVRTYSIIYEIIDDVKALAARLAAGGD